MQLTTKHAVCIAPHFYHGITSEFNSTPSIELCTFFFEKQKYFDGSLTY